MSSQKAKGKQVIDTIDDDNELSVDESEQPTNEPDAQATSSKKKRKKKSKLAKILEPVSGAAEDKLVETLLSRMSSMVNLVWVWGRATRTKILVSIIADFVANVIFWTPAQMEVFPHNITHKL
jgi:hypothetical protein